MHPDGLEQDDKRRDVNQNRTKFTNDERIADFNRELLSAYKELAASLENLKKKYELQQEFINIAAHEIRGPCQAIIGYVELLNLEPTNSKRYLELITINAERLNLLISNVLDASRIDNNTLILKREKFNLLESVEQIIEDINNKIKTERNKNVEVIFEDIQLEDRRQINDNKDIELDEEARKMLIVN